MRYSILVNGQRIAVTEKALAALSTELAALEADPLTRYETIDAVRAVVYEMTRALEQAELRNE